MLSRIPPPLAALGASVLLLAGLLGALYWNSQSAYTTEPLEIYCAEAMRGPMEAVAREYEKEYGQHVFVHFGPSKTALVTLETRKKGDLFLPADDSYMRKDLVEPGINLARMHAVVIVRPGYPGTISTWNDFLAPGNKIGIANPEAAAISKVLKEKLPAGHWDALAGRKPNYLGNINEVGNSVANVESNDVGIVWDAVAHLLQANKPGLKIVKLKELEHVNARLQIAVAKCSTHADEALRFVRYLRARDKGAPYLKKQGFSDVEEGVPMDSWPEVVVYAGAMLRPVLEEALNQFEKQEGIRITRVYNGCGILVSQMETGATPDVYFACDTRFMDQVKDKFGKPTNVSSNQLVIAIKKGNPHNLHELTDLGKPGLRVGVGHEQQCALGAITKETFIRTGVYARVRKNVVVESPTGDFLVNQLRTGSLDVVLAYRSNVAPFADELEGIPVTGIPCAVPQQPIAISKKSTHPEVARRLMEFLRSEDSRQRFEKLGFGWELKEVDVGR